METKKIIATYSRVSTAVQEEQQTIKTQLNTLKEFSDTNNYQIVQEYIDEGWSGDILARPALDRLRQDAKSKIWNAVLIYDPDRLARRYSYQELIMDELREAGIEVIFVTVSAPKNSEDKILYGVRGLFAEYERTKISERFRLGKVRKVKEGHVLLSEAPYGYNYIAKVENTHGYLEINPIEANVVRMIFQWIDEEGLTQRKIIRRLLEMNIMPRKSIRGVWSTSTLTTLLKNKTYIGEARWGSSYCVAPQNPRILDKYRKNKKSSRRNKPESEWYIIPVPPIITKELFDRVRSRIEANFEFSKRNTKNEYLLTGIMFCICGKRRTGEGPQNGRYLYYRCCGRVNNFPLPATCFEKGIDARIADNLVWNKISELMTSTELLAEQNERFSNNEVINPTNFNENIADYESEIYKLKREEDRYNKAYGAGLFTVEKLGEYVLPIRNKIQSFEIQISKMKQVQIASEIIVLPTKPQIELFTQKAKEVLSDLNFYSKKSIMLQVVDKIIGTPNQLIICGYIPITIENNVCFCSSDRNRQSTNRQSVPFSITIKLPNKEK